MFISQQLQAWWQCENAGYVRQIYIDTMHSWIVTYMSSQGGISNSGGVGGGGGGSSSDGGGSGGSLLYY